MTLKPLSWKNYLCAGLLLSISMANHAVDSASLEFGSGNKTDLARIGLQWNWDRQWWKSNGSHLGGYWDVTLAHWRATRFRNRPNNTHSFEAVGITPVFRLQNDDLMGLYGEAAIGLRHLFGLYDNNDHRLSTHFQFSSHLGIGYVFRNNIDLGLKIQHFSNGSIKKPNDGVNFVAVRASYRF